MSLAGLVAAGQPSNAAFTWAFGIAAVAGVLGVALASGIENTRAATAG